MGSFQARKGDNLLYAGIVFVAGNADHGIAAIDAICSTEGDSFTDFKEKIEAKSAKSMQKQEGEIADHLRRQGQLLVDSIPEGPMRERAAHEHVGMAEQGIGRWYTQLSETSTIMVVYDAEKNSVGLYAIVPRAVNKVHRDELVIGSGLDGANFYLTSRLQGVDIRRRNVDDLLYFATNAYSMSTTNAGVGGTPNIAVVSSNGVKSLSLQQSRALVNLSGAYLARYKATLTTNRVRRDMAAIRANQASYGAIATTLGLNKATLLEICVDYRTWQTRANERTFTNSK
jgi:hypothetical protein